MCDATQINSAYSTNIITALRLYLLNSPHREANSLFNEIPVEVPPFGTKQINYITEPDCDSIS